MDPEALALGGDGSRLGFLEEGLDRADGVGGVGNYYVMVDSLSEAVADVDGYFWGGRTCVGGGFWIRLRGSRWLGVCCGLGHWEEGDRSGRYLVDIAEDDLLDGVVLEDFTRDAASNDQYLLLARKREMGDHLVPAYVIIDLHQKKKIIIIENSRELVALGVEIFGLDID